MNSRNNIIKEVLAKIDGWTRGAFTGWDGHTHDSKITLDEAEDHFNLCMRDMIDDVKTLLEPEKGNE